MAIPSGSGTEVLKRAFIASQGEAEGTLITGVANHIYTNISVMAMEKGGFSDSKFYMYIDANAAGTDVYMLDSVAVPSQTLFVFNDKFVLTGTDKLHCKGSSAGSAATYDVWCSYIDQDWT